MPLVKGLPILACFALILLLVFLAWGGTYSFAPTAFFDALFAKQNADPMTRHILWSLRIPRAIGDLLIGAILGSVGAAFQAYFRNPLAEPYIVGVSSGAGLLGTILIVLGLGGAVSGLALMGAGAIGGVLGLILVLALVGSRKRLNIQNLLLAGVVIGTMLASLMTLLMLLSGKDTNQIMRWLLGSTTPMFWPKIWTLLILLVGGVALLMSHARALNAYQFSDGLARRVGVDPVKSARLVLGTGTVMVGATVGAAGIIGFIGLVAPHICRKLFGSDSRWLIPYSALLGGGLLILADFIGIKVGQGMELPVGAVTAILGTPFLLLLLKN